MSEYVKAHDQSRDRIGALIGPLSEAELGMIVPACPHWTIHDLVSHLAGLAEDFCGDLTTIMQPGFWDHDEVDRREVIPRRGSSTAEVFAEWTELSPRFDDVIAAAAPPLAGGIVGDYVCHEHDIRAALGRPGERDSAEVQLGLDIYARSLGARVDAAGLPSLVIGSGGREWTLGDGVQGATVTAAPFEMFRALTGRRTREEVAAFDWSGDSDSYLKEFSMFDWPDSSLNE